MPADGTRSGCIRLRRAIAAQLAVLALIALTAAAAAADEYSYSHSIYGQGSSRLEGVADVAVDSSSGGAAHGVYVTEPESHRVQKFAPDGAFVLSFGPQVDKTSGADVCTASSGHFCGVGSPSSEEQLSRPTKIAVDSSSGPSAGDVYVSDSYTIRKFTSSGIPVTGWANNGVLEAKQFVWDLAVAADGRLVVLEEGRTVAIYSPQGEQIWSAAFASQQGYFRAVATGTGESLFLATWGGGDGVERATMAGGSLGPIGKLGGAASVAVDPSAASVFVTGPWSSVKRISTGCVVSTCATDDFATGLLKENFSHPLAVDTGTHALYVLNAPGPEFGPSELAVLMPPGGRPVVETSPTQLVFDGEATLFGKVTPGAGGQAECRLEYVDLADFSKEGFFHPSIAGCEPGGPGSDSSAVHAKIPNLAPGDGFKYRFQARGPGGSSAGSVRGLVVGARPVVENLGSIGEGPTSANLTGTVTSTSDSEITRCYFEVAEVGGPQSASRTAECLPQTPYAGNFVLSVRGSVTGLEPETRYRFRLIAISTEWQVFSKDEEFRTGAAESEQPPREKRIRHRHRIPCSAHVCTAKLTASATPRIWVSPRFPKGYGWSFRLFRGGSQISDSSVEKGCRVKFSAPRVHAQLYGCGEHLRLTYYGSGSFQARWRVFGHCTCANPGQPIGGPGRARPRVVAP